uniref:NADH-ubiquinone oxidoreductase chain 3 n=1 Tax=Loxilobus prominenoculus TaxID=2793212 RepID=A0A7T0NCY1_9ORTH|nr:NADH dehydrogenase subunit 3 [Loxilobus prominenoculus]
MYLLMITMMVSITIPLIMALLSKMISKKTTHDREKLSPFECGFNPQTHSRLPFSVQFFLISVLFLVFDIEITLILPIIPIMKTSMIKYWWTTSSVFIAILISGLYYEWNQGMLKWTF